LPTSQRRLLATTRTEEHSQKAAKNRLEADGVVATPGPLQGAPALDLQHDCPQIITILLLFFGLLAIQQKCQISASGRQKTSAKVNTCFSRNALPVVACIQPTH
jgi:hypothetical protein